METWKRIETWLKANHPETYRDLNPPASDAQLQAAAAALSIIFPPEMIAVYRGHNGQVGIRAALTGEWQFLSLEDMVIQWRGQKELLEEGAFEGADAESRGPVRADWWNPKWIPVAYNGAGDLQCVDLEPAEGGSLGQVVIYWHDRELRECVASSLQSWLEMLADDFEGGKYSVEDNQLVRH